MGTPSNVGEERCPWSLTSTVMCMPKGGLVSVIHLWLSERKGDLWPPHLRRYQPGLMKGPRAAGTPLLLDSFSCLLWIDRGIWMLKIPY